MLFLVLSRTPLKCAHSDFMFCLNNILQQLTLLTKCKPDHPKGVLAAHRKLLCTLYNHLYFLHIWQWLWTRSTTISHSSADTFQQWFQKANAIRASCLHQLFTASDCSQKANYETKFHKTPSQVPKCSKNTQSLESILKGKVIKEFLPHTQKEQRAPQLKLHKSWLRANHLLRRWYQNHLRWSTTLPGAAAAATKVTSTAASHAAVTTMSSAAAFQAAADSCLEPASLARISILWDSSRHSLCAQALA